MGADTSSNLVVGSCYKLLLDFLCLHLQLKL